MNKNKTLKAEIVAAIHSWSYKEDLTLYDLGYKRLINALMTVINKRVNQLDIGEMMKQCMWDNEGKGSLTYGDLSTYIEKCIIEALS
jgi:hypothetical protein